MLTHSRYREDQTFYLGTLLHLRSSELPGEPNLLTQVLLIRQSDMALHSYVTINLYDDLFMEIRLETIYRYLPTLYRKYAEHPSRASSLRPQYYLKQALRNACSREALCDLFEYLRKEDLRPEKSPHLQACLEKDRMTHRIRDGLREGTFFALGRMFRPDNFGCNVQIWYTMADFVVRHFTEIHPSLRRDYIRVLQDMDADNRLGLRNVLWHSAPNGRIRSYDLEDICCSDKLAPKLRRLLEKLKRQMDRLSSIEADFGCSTCELRRCYPDMRFLEEHAYIEPLAQCLNCRRFFGPLLAAAAANHVREPRLLQPTAHNHHHHYELERNRQAWYGDPRQCVPRYLQPMAVDAARPRRPRHDRWMLPLTT